MSALNDEDYNGECFVVGSSGEREEVLENRRVYVVSTIPFTRGGNTAFNGTLDEHKNHLDLFYRMQYWGLVLAYHDIGDVPAAVDNVNPVATAPAVDGAVADRLKKVAYIRTMAAKSGMYHFAGTAVSHHTRYSEFSVLDWPGLQQFARKVFQSPHIVITDLNTALAALNDPGSDNQMVEWRRAYRPKHMDAVCTVAYFFRVRGHHFTQEMEDRYKQVWRKCLYDEDGPGVGWQFIAHDALHAIFPDDLDEIWLDASRDDHCAGALSKRVNALPAGIAGISAINSGVADLRMIVPKALDIASDAMDHLEQINDNLDNSRWSGSINRRFYNAPEVRVNEALLSSLASIIVAGLENMAPQSPLLKSAALKRIANNALMTGSVVGRMIVTAIKSDAAAETFLPDLRSITDGREDR